MDAPFLRAARTGSGNGGQLRNVGGDRRLHQALPSGVTRRVLPHGAVPRVVSLTSCWCVSPHGAPYLG
eukprot:749201-Prorocentrum_minimum.AAC.1